MRAVEGRIPFRGFETWYRDVGPEGGISDGELTAIHQINVEIERLKTDLAGEEEFVRARKQSRAQYVYSQETATSQA